MLVLRSSAVSPFGRKIKIGAALLGLGERIEIVAADTNDPDDSLRTQNPLGKIPILIREDGEAVYDSRVILEYLDGLAGGGVLFPSEPAKRLEVSILQALADGIMDAAILQIYEMRFREPALRSGKWLDYQQGKVARALTTLEARPPAAGARDAGAVALACALGYLDLRFEGSWRSAHPRLVGWLEAFSAAVPAFEATRSRG